MNSQNIESELEKIRTDVDEKFTPDNLARQIDSSYLFSINHLRTFISLLAILFTFITVIFSVSGGILASFGWNGVNKINETLVSVKNKESEISTALKEALKMKSEIQFQYDELKKFQEQIEAKMAALNVKYNNVNKRSDDILKNLSERDKSYDKLFKETRDYLLVLKEAVNKTIPSDEPQLQSPKNLRILID